MFLTRTRVQFAAETKCARCLNASDDENLSGAISWFTFWLQSSEHDASEERLRGRACVNRPCHAKDFSESEQHALLGPVGRKPRGLAHQRFGVELLRLASIDNCRGDVGCQPGQPQESIDVGGGHVLLARDVVHRPLGILTEACLYIVCTSDNPEHARIDCGFQPWPGLPRASLCGSSNPATSVSTGQHAKAPQNRAVPRHFPDTACSPCRELGYRSAIPAPGLRGHFLVSRFCWIH